MRHRLALFLFFCTFLFGGLSLTVAPALAASTQSLQDQSSTVNDPNALSSLSQGIVPPGYYGNYDPAGYGTCELVQLANNVIRFIIGIAAVIGVVMFMYAGYLLVTGGSNSSTRTKARRLFMSVILGFTFILTAFLIVNTILTVLVGGDSSLLHWNTFQCVYENQVGSATSINQAVSDAQRLATQRIVNTVDPSVVQANAASCNPSYMDSWGQNSVTARCIAQNESSCGGSLVSQTDIASDGNAFSFGAYQINTTVNSVTACSSLGIPNLDCPAAWSGTNYNAHVVNQSLYQECMKALMNPDCSTAQAQALYKQAGGWSPWAADNAACGLGLTGKY